MTTPKMRLFGNLSISTMAVGAIGIVVVISAAAVGWFAFRGAEQTIRSAALKQLDTVRSSRARLVSNFLSRTHSDLDAASRLPATRDLLKAAPAPAPRSSRQRRPTARAAESARLQQAFQPVARGLRDVSGYRDVFLIGADGTVLYSSTKAVDAGTSWKAGPPTSPDLAFVSAPVLDAGTRRRLGVIAGTLSFDQINAIMTDTVGTGPSSQPDLTPLRQLRLRLGALFIVMSLGMAALLLYAVLGNMTSGATQLALTRAQETLGQREAELTETQGGLARTQEALEQAEASLHGAQEELKQARDAVAAATKAKTAQAETLKQAQDGLKQSQEALKRARQEVEAANRARDEALAKPRAPVAEAASPVEAPAEEPPRDAAPNAPEAPSRVSREAVSKLAADLRADLLAAVRGGEPEKMHDVLHRVGDIKLSASLRSLVDDGAYGQLVNLLVG